MKIVFFGSGSHAFSVIEELRKEFELIVFTTEKEKTDPLIKYCIENNITYSSFSPLQKTYDLKKIKNEKADIAIVASFRVILNKDLLNLFPNGVINIHPSLLPQYRGATPGQSAILNGDKTTGVSIIKLDEQMDHGPIIWQKEEQILPEDTARSLHTRLFGLAASVINEVTNKYLKGEVDLIPQDDTKATYIKKLNRDSGYFDFKNPPNKELLDRMIRAYFPWPGVWTEYKDLRIKLLPEKMLQVEGKKPISLKDFENGYPQIYKDIVKLFHES